MPQLASRMTWNGDYIFGSDSLLRNPSLAAVMGAVIVGWTSIETELGRVFGNLVGVKHQITMDMYGIHRSFDAQKKLLSLVSRKKFAKRYADLFDASLTVLTRVAVERNRFAHWVCGASMDPNLEALLFVEPRHFWNLHVKQVKTWNSKNGPNSIYKLGPVVFLQNRPTLKHENIYIYRRKDLDEINARVDRAYRIAYALRELAASDASRRRAIYRWLNSESDIQTALQKSRRGHSQNRQSPAAPQGKARKKTP